MLVAASSVALTSCSKLGKLGAENFNVTPTPLEAIGGQVPATINGTFPTKYMKKKATVTVVPVLKYEGGEAIGQSATFQGEKVEGNGTTINYKVGGTYTMKTTFPYQDAMLNSELYARFEAKKGKKTVSIPEVKIGYGVVATSQLLSRCAITPAMAPDAWQRIIAHKQEANIKFLINVATLRTSELKTVSIKELVAVLKEINDDQETRALQGIEVSAYASPDGKYNFNEKLAEKRQKVSADYMKKELKKIKMQAEVDTKFTAEDWEGFQQLVSQSNLQDKDVRKAIFYAINRNDMLTAGYSSLDYATPSVSFLPKTNGYYTEDLEQYNQDIAKAQELLAGKTVPTLKICYIGGNYEQTAMATVMQAQLAQVGINLELCGVDQAAYMAAAYDCENTEYDMYMGGYIMTIDPAGYDGMFATGNMINYASAEIDALFEQGKATTDPAERQAIYTKLQQLVAD